ncbi:MAG: formate/nitrite transporter family protein [Paenibacillus dendritiformis]|uniref:formate/nitrite transporter family protein n=1 Tax=uncultured Paenibacillus sp. TaxID=227322 RepID=UPI0025EBBC4B|nr:formate/nitrite transporter family protein [uncultured Paenibacillus sp.]MDU5145500.1 formate/nitrite transporter family protein [Paenibacillus dendritiformis]
MEQRHALDQVEALALKKKAAWDSCKFPYLLRSILASMFIGFGIVVAFKTGNLFDEGASPFAYTAAAVTFGAAIILIGYAGGDLFTGNTFYFTFSALRGSTTWGDVLKMWGASYGGNLIGALLFAALLWGTGLFREPHSNVFFYDVVAHKMDAPALQLFFRAILCNWLVCMAFFIPMSLKGDGPKLFAMILFVYCFFISGFEHSIANMTSFAIALIMEHRPGISVYGALHNLIPVTFGNIIGGSFFMGAVYFYLEKVKT